MRVKVGGGRGDLALAVARALPEVLVTVVDSNKASLDAGCDAALHRGLANVRFVHADFAQLRDEDCPLLRDATFVLALHACGGLSDCALDFAARIAARFLIVPCCYVKHCELISPGASLETADRRVVARLAELDEQADVQRRAMRLIDSRRLATYARRARCKALAHRQLSMSTFDRAFSRRNVVLAATSATSAEDATPKSALHA